VFQPKTIKDGKNGVLNYYFLFVIKNVPDENCPKFRGRGFTYKPGNKKFGGGAGI
jgi:hypothetical protein